MARIIANSAAACAAGGLAGGPAQAAPPQAAAAPAVSVREAVAELPGVRLFYRDSGGSGPAVVLLHAGTGSSRVWEYQWPAFAGAGYRVIAYDRRGYADTRVVEGGPLGTAPDDLVALLDQLGLDRIHLVGTAAGGMVAVDFALSYPARLRSLTIANSVYGVQDAEYLELGQRLRPKGFAEMTPDLRELSPGYRAADPDGTKRWLALEHESRAPGPRPRPQPPKNKVTLAALETIRVPALLITGETDLYTPLPAFELVAARMRHAERLVLPEVAHSAYWEKPELFNRAVLAFIAKH